MTQPVQVLLVEDSEADAILLTYRIERHDEPIAITRVDTPFALQAALDSGSWDFVISDYHLALMSGLLALELVRRHSPDLPFILVSGTVGEDIAVDAMRSGANDYVMKNKLARLLPAFQRELRASRARREGLVERDQRRSHIERLARMVAATGAETLAMENRLRRALERGEFMLHYQPKVSLRDHRIVGVEALLRWKSPELGVVDPCTFVPMLEETGLILEVGAWVVRKAVADHRRWARLHSRAPRIAVNVSVGQLQDPGFVAMVRDAIAGCGGTPGIDLEITESLAMDDVAQCIAKLTEIRALGVGAAIDDFGTGYSSLAYLAKLPVNAVKIERMFIADMLGNPGTMRLVTTMIDLAHSLRLKAIAEGIETPEQATALRALHCDEGQGYLFGRPMSWEALSELLDKAPTVVIARRAMLPLRWVVRRSAGRHSRTSTA